MTRRRVGPLVALVLALLVAGCGAAEPGSETTASEPGTSAERNEPQELVGYGLQVELPPGWRGDVTKAGPPEGAPLLRAATFPLSEPPSDGGQQAQANMEVDDILIEVIDYGHVPGAEEGASGALPIELDRSHVNSFEGFRGPVATTSLAVHGRTLQLWVVTAREPTDEQLAQANAVLATLDVTPPPRVGDAGVTVALPTGWQTTTPDDGVVTDPVTRLVVASSPVSPKESASQIAAYAFDQDAVALVVVEWTEPSGVAQERPYPFRPQDLPILPAPAIEAFDGPGGAVFFVDDGRTFGAYLLVGPAAGATAVVQARRVLDTLRVEPV